MARLIEDSPFLADTSSLWLLAELAPALRTMAAAVLVTARDGDWDQARQSEHAAAVTLIRP